MMHNIFELIKKSDESEIIIGIQSLLLEGVDLNQRDENGHTLLSIALLTKKIKVAEFLLAEVANIDHTYGLKKISNIADIIRIKGIDIKLDGNVNEKPEPEVVVPVKAQPVDEEKVPMAEVMRRIKANPEITPTVEEKKVLPKLAMPKISLPKMESVQKKELPEVKTETKLSRDELRQMAEDLKKKPSEPANKENVVKKSQNAFNAFKVRVEKGKAIWRRINNEDE